MSARKIFIPFAPSSYPESILRGLNGGSLYPTACDMKKLKAARLALSVCGECGVGWVTKTMTLEDIAPAVIDCVEKLGGIDCLLFAAELSSKEKLFLDINPTDFTSHVMALNAFFMSCKCALPYMLESLEPKIIVSLGSGPDNLTERMHRAAMESLLADMEKEFACYGLKVEKL